VRGGGETEYYLYPVAGNEDIDVELVVLTDEDIIREIEKYMERSGVTGRSMARVVSDIVSELKRRGYLVSEDRVKRLLKELCAEKPIFGR